MNQSTFTIICWGCSKSETHLWTGLNKDYDNSIKMLQEKGWQRRQFGPIGNTADPWFCSEDCAYKSYNARCAEEYWKKDKFRQYKKESLFKKFWRFLNVGK